MIKLRSLAPRPYVMADDPSIDQNSKALDWDAFVKTGDLAHVPVIEGGRLTVFQVRGLNRRQWQSVLAAPKSDQGFIALRFGLVSVSCLENEDGSPVTITLEPSDLGERLTQDSFDRLGAFVGLVKDVSQAVLGLSTVITDPT